MSVRCAEPHARTIVDVTKGNNTVAVKSGAKIARLRGYRARRGYDLTTGVGTIDAARFARAHPGRQAVAHGGLRLCVLR
jgi:hypothetical protein